MRLQKYLSQQGLLSRRKAEEAIQKGWVLVNGTPATVGQKIDPEKDEIRLTSEIEQEKETFSYVLFYKPKGIVTHSPQPGEKAIQDIVPPLLKSLAPVGRLDKDSEGLILLTNDGIVAKHLLQNSPPHERIYDVWVNKTLEEDQRRRMETGMYVLGSRTRKAKVIQLAEKHYEIHLWEGKNRQIRRMIQQAGSQVTRLKRIAFGPFTLDDLTPGNWKIVPSRTIKALF